MPRDGSGNYSRVAGSAYTNGTTADGPELDAEMDDIATALTNSVTRDGSAAMTGNLNMGGNGITNLGSLSVTTNLGAASLRAGAGTSSAPSITFSADTTTGFYQPANYSISYVQNGTRIWTVSTAGNMGVGTTSPSDKLHVNGGVRIEDATAPTAKWYVGTTYVGRIFGSSTTMTVEAQSVTGETYVGAGGNRGLRVVGRSTKADALLGSGTLLTTSDRGHSYINAVSGVPTGTPASYTGWGAIQIDTLNNRLYVYVSGAWRYVSLT